MSLFNLVHYDFHLGELGPLFSKAKKRHYKYYEYEINFVKQYLQLLMINRHIFILIATPLGPYIMGTKRFFWIRRSFMSSKGLVVVGK